MTLTNNDNRIHRAISADGTEIVGRVHGQGPPLVLLSGTCEGEAFPLLLPQLSEQFTCYSVSLRGRGLSTDHPDHTPERLVEDVRAFADSIERPVRLAAHSRGAALSLSAAVHTNSLSAIAIYDPHVIELYSSEKVARVQQVGLMRAAADEGRFDNAVRTFFRDIAPLDNGELTAVSTSEAAEQFAPAVPFFIQDAGQWGLPRSRDLLELEQVTVPVLLLYGGNSHRFYVDAVRYLAGQLPNADVRKIDGLGHLGPLFSPESVAGEIVSFFSKN